MKIGIKPRWFMDKKNKNSERKTKTRPFTERVRAAFPICEDSKDKVNNLRRGLQKTSAQYLSTHQEFHRVQENRRDEQVEEQQAESSHLRFDRILNSTWIQCMNNAVKNEVK